MTEAVYGLYIGIVSGLPLINSVVPFFKDKGAPLTVWFSFFIISDIFNDWLIDSIVLGSYRSTSKL